MKRPREALLGLLWVQVCSGVRGMEVEQRPPVLSVQEGASSTLSCNFSSTANNVRWFRQNPGGGGLTRLFIIASGMKQDGRLDCTLDRKERHSSLHIRASRQEDSATYLCAVEAQCCLPPCSLSPKCSWARSPGSSIRKPSLLSSICTACLGPSGVLQAQSWWRYALPINYYKTKVCVRIA